MNRERIDAWLERGILGSVLAMLVFAPLALGAVRVSEFVVVQALTVLVLGLWLVRVWVVEDFAVLWPPVAWGVVVFVVLAVIRYAQADIEYVARDEVLRIVVYAAVFLAVLQNLHRAEGAQAIVLTLILVAVGLSFYAGFQALTGSRTVWHLLRPDQYLKRGSGTYINPNHLAGFLELVLPLALAFTLMARISHAAKVMTGYAALVILAGIAATVSRGGWIATVLGVLLFFSVLASRRGYRIAALGFFLLVAGVGALLVANTQHSQQRFEQMLAGGRLDDVRFHLWKPTVQMWLDHLWLGVGPGHFDHRFAEYRPAFIPFQPDRAHNDYLNLLADWGVLGANAVLVVWGLLFAGAARSWKLVQRGRTEAAAQHGTRSALVLGAVVGLLTLLLHAVTDFNFHIPANALVATTLAALLAGLSRYAGEQHWWKGGLVGRWVFTLVLLALLVALGATGVRRWRESELLARAGKPQPGDNSLALLEQAHAVEPNNFETSYKLGQISRRTGWETRDDAPVAAAITWFDRSLAANPHYVYSALGRGMCLDWLGRDDEGARDFARAARLDPEGFYTLAFRGWHEMQLGNDAKARELFEASLGRQVNPIARSYLEILRARAPQNP